MTPPPATGACWYSTRGYRGMLRVLSRADAFMRVAYLVAPLPSPRGPPPPPWNAEWACDF
jgi:hypothetical protein